MIPLLLFIKLICFSEYAGIAFVDSTRIVVSNKKRISTDRVFRDLAETRKGGMGWFSGFKLHLVCNDKGELLNFCFTKGNTDDRNRNVFRVLSRDLSGRLYGNKGCISSSLFELLFCNGIHLVIGIKSNMKNRLISLRNKTLLRKQSVIEMINNELKNICQVEHSRPEELQFPYKHVCWAAYCFFDKKSAIRFERDLPNGQLSLFC
jgi:hypothetical protein